MVQWAARRFKWFSIWKPSVSVWECKWLCTANHFCLLFLLLPLIFHSTDTSDGWATWMESQMAIECDWFSEFRITFSKRADRKKKRKKRKDFFGKWLRFDRIIHRFPLRFIVNCHMAIEPLSLYQFTPHFIIRDSLLASKGFASIQSNRNVNAASSTRSIWKEQDKYSVEWLARIEYEFKNDTCYFVIECERHFVFFFSVTAFI